MTLTLERAKLLDGLLEAVREGTSKSHQRALLLSIINQEAPIEMNSFVVRHGYSSLAELRTHLRRMDDAEALGGLVILGDALLAAYLLSRRR